MPKSLPPFPFSFRKNEVIGCFWRYFGWDYSLIGKILHLEVLIREFRGMFSVKWKKRTVIIIIGPIYQQALSMILCYRQANVNWTGILYA